jgi:hypothetical protein
MSSGEESEEEPRWMGLDDSEEPCGRPSSLGGRMAGQ